MPHKPASTALDHIRVLDLTRVRSGPTCVRQLADWGADAIKIEMPAALEADGALGAGRATSDFQNLHRNKRSLTLNLKEPDGKAVFMKLVETADVVVENFRPDVKHRLGIEYDALAAVNPRIILASISGFGQDGPYAKRPGFDQIAQGMGGLQSITGEPGRGPMRVGIPVADLTAGHFAAQGILIALLEREKSGKGQWLHTSLLQAQIAMLDFQATRWLIDRDVPPQVGNDHPTSMPTGLFHTSDGAINIAVSGKVTWERFCHAAGQPDWIEDERFVDGSARLQNREALNSAIQDVIGTKSSAEWVSAMNQAGVPCGPVNSIDQTFADEQVQHLGVAAEIDTLPFGATQMVAQPVRLTRTPTSMVAHPPDRGEHTDEVLAEAGLDAAQIAESQIAQCRLTVSNAAIIHPQIRFIWRPQRRRLQENAFDRQDDPAPRRADRAHGFSISPKSATPSACRCGSVRPRSSMISRTIPKSASLSCLAPVARPSSLAPTSSEFEDKRGTAEAQQHYNAQTGAVYERIERFAKPTVAMINGFCIGGGLNLACVCDIRICSDKSQFGMPAARLALGYPFPAIKRLADIVGIANAREPNVHRTAHRCRACAQCRSCPTGGNRGRARTNRQRLRQFDRRECAADRGRDEIHLHAGAGRSDRPRS